MMQTGIFTGYFPYGLEESAAKIRALDFNTVQLDMHFKDLDVSAGQITKDKCIRIRETFRDHNLPISCISGYTNIIHPDRTEREKRVGYLKEIIAHAQYL
ncbi:MAG: TIM barrel protein, partial [Phyllobacterium sp.]